MTPLIIWIRVSAYKKMLNAHVGAVIPKTIVIQQMSKKVKPALDVETVSVAVAYAIQIQTLSTHLSK
ncbi:unnamed protein product, partial [Iphiclides podalirius]